MGQNNCVRDNQNTNIIANDDKYTYCVKCGARFTTPSPTPFCDKFCRREYFAEIRSDNDDLFGEYIGRD